MYQTEWPLKCWLGLRGRARQSVVSAHITETFQVVARVRQPSSMSTGSPAFSSHSISAVTMPCCTDESTHLKQAHDAEYGARKRQHKQCNKQQLLSASSSNARRLQSRLRMRVGRWLKDQSRLGGLIETCTPECFLCRCPSTWACVVSIRKRSPRRSIGMGGRCPTTTVGRNVANNPW